MPNSGISFDILEDFPFAKFDEKYIKSVFTSYILFSVFDTILKVL